MEEKAALVAHENIIRRGKEEDHEKSFKKSNSQLSLKAAMIDSCLPSTIMMGNNVDNIFCCSVVDEVRSETNMIFLNPSQRAEGL
jgi:hypothetical protein